MDVMKKTIEVVYANSFKINKGNYEQEAPLYSAKTILEFNGTSVHDDEFKQDIEKTEYKRLRSIVDPLLHAQVAQAKCDLSGVRIRERDGKRYPSVTSILSPDSPSIDPEYAIRGLAIEEIMRQKFKTDKWLGPINKLKKIKYDEIKYKEWWEKYKHSLRFQELDAQEVYNTRLKYSGEIDLICFIDDIPTIVDIKTGGWGWPQLIAYAQCDDMNFKQVAIFDLKKCEMPILKLGDRKSKDAWERFLVKRGCFEQRFGI